MHIMQVIGVFGDSNKRSFKAVLLYNGNKYASIPHAYFTSMKVKYQVISVLLEKIKYSCLGALCPLENGQFYVRLKELLHKISLFYLFLG